MSIAVKNTDRASRPVYLSDGRQIDPGCFGDAPDDSQTAALIDAGLLTKSSDPTDPAEDPHPAMKTAARHPRKES